MKTADNQNENSRQFLTEIDRITEHLEHNGIATVNLLSNYKIEKPEDLDCITVTSDKVMTEIVNNRNQVFIRSVLEWAKSKGYTYINLIDAQFIKAAFSAEFDRGYAVGYNEGFIAGLQGSEPNVKD